MDADRTLSNAPLVEVIAEVHWEIATSADGQEFDPGWFDLVSQLTPDLSRILPAVERLVPEGVTVPLELLGRVPLRRFRREAGGWPLVQLGQGLLTVNAVPPYDGWSAISGLLERVLRASIDASPVFGGARLKSLKLQYRDAFTASHGLSAREIGLTEYFPLSTINAATALSGVGAVSPYPTKVEWMAGLPSLSAAVILSASMGSVAQSGRSQDAMVLDLVVQSTHGGVSLDYVGIMDWFGKAHDVAWGLFSGIVPTNVMAHLQSAKS